MLYLQTATGRHDVSSADALRERVLTLLERDGDATYWLFRDDTMIGGFFYNGAYACVQRLPDGAWSHNPSHTGNDVALFELENGQLDEFPMSCCIDLEQALDAFVEIARTGQLSPAIAWC